MTSSGVRRFNCPTCGALYKVVQVEADPATSYGEITCRRCDGPLLGQSGGFLLKYFFVDRPRRTDARHCRAIVMIAKSNERSAHFCPQDEEGLGTATSFLTPEVDLNILSLT